MTKTLMEADGSYFNASKMGQLISIAVGIPTNLALANLRANSGLGSISSTTSRQKAAIFA